MCAYTPEHAGLDKVASLRVVFADESLRRIAEDASYMPPRWGTDLIKSYRKKIQLLHAATDERDLYAMHSLHLKQLKGGRSGTSSLRLNDQFRLIIQFRTDNQDRVVIVIEMVDYH